MFKVFFWKGPLMVSYINHTCIIHKSYSLKTTVKNKYFTESTRLSLKKFLWSTVGSCVMFSPLLLVKIFRFDDIYQFPFLFINLDFLLENTCTTLFVLDCLTLWCLVEVDFIIWCRFSSCRSVRQEELFMSLVCLFLQSHFRYIVLGWIT